MLLSCLIQTNNCVLRSVLFFIQFLLLKFPILFAHIFPYLCFNLFHALSCFCLSLLHRLVFVSSGMLLALFKEPYASVRFYVLFRDEDTNYNNYRLDYIVSCIFITATWGCFLLVITSTFTLSSSNSLFDYCVLSL